MLDVFKGLLFLEVPTETCTHRLRGSSGEDPMCLQHHQVSNTATVAAANAIIPKFGFHSHRTVYIIIQEKEKNRTSFFRRFMAC